MAHLCGVIDVILSVPRIVVRLPNQGISPVSYCNPIYDLASPQISTVAIYIVGGMFQTSFDRYSPLGTMVHALLGRR